jgi:hypothetical protein
MINNFVGQYRFLSNFWSCFIYYEGDRYPSVENAFQAAKCRNKEERSKFFHCKASEAKHLGRIVQLRDGWNEMRNKIMQELVAQKFSVNPLRQLLLDTDNEQLEEGNWWGDTYWGTVNGAGENHLGKIIMLERTKLLCEEPNLKN